MGNIIIVITLYQPYATLLAYGIKKNETRPGKTSHTLEKGKYLIHAAKKFNKELTELCNREPIRTELAEIGFRQSKHINGIGGSHGRWIHDLPLGQIIGSFEVRECVTVGHTFKENNHIAAAFALSPTEGGISFKYPELSYGDYSEGRTIWIGQNHKVLENPIAYKGQQGYYAKFKGDINQLIYK